MTLATKDIKTTLEQLMIQLNELPELPYQRKNIFQIAGFPRRELVNSNMLAFYLNKNEEHGLGTLFFKSLLQIMGEDTSMADVDYEVFTEYRNIDILITFRNEDNEMEEDNEKFDWAIIIENKIHHYLHNDLKDYLKRAKTKRGGLKKGIVLSPWGQEGLKLPKEYKDIRHQDLTKQVLGNLPKFYLKSDDRHLLLLKEYILNIDTMYTNQETMNTKEKRLQIFQDNFDDIQNIISLDKEMRKFVVQQSLDVMGEFGFDGNSSNTAVKTKSFQVKKESIIPSYFRFYFFYINMTAKGELNMNFELYAKFAKYGEAFQAHPKFEEMLNGHKDILKKGGAKGNGYFHLFYVSDEKFRAKDSKESYYDDLKNFMKTHFFNKENGVFIKCLEIAKEIIPQEEPSKNKDA